MGERADRAAVQSEKLPYQRLAVGCRDRIDAHHRGDDVIDEVGEFHVHDFEGAARGEGVPLLGVHGAAGAREIC